MTTLLDIARSLRRSHGRRRVLLALHELERATLAQLAEHARMETKRVHAVLHGQLPGFRPELSLLALGLATTEHAVEGASYAITARGQLMVKSLARGGLKLVVDGPAASAAQAAEASREAALAAERAARAAAGAVAKATAVRDGTCSVCGARAAARAGNGEPGEAPSHQA